MAVVAAVDVAGSRHVVVCGVVRERGGAVRVLLPPDLRGLDGGVWGRRACAGYAVRDVHAVAGETDGVGMEAVGGGHGCGRAQDGVFPWLGECQVW